MAAREPRQTLLINSFSYLPVIVGEGGNKSFHLIADFAVTRYLRTAKDTNPEESLAIPLAEILNVPGGLATTPAVCLCDASEAISTVITRLSGEPVLVVDNLEKPTRLEGILTAYDLL